MNILKIQGICTCDPKFQYEKNRFGQYMPVCRYILAAPRPKSRTADYIYCVAFGERAITAHEEIKAGTEVFIQGHYIQNPETMILRIRKIIMLWQQLTIKKSSKKLNYADRN